MSSYLNELTSIDYVALVVLVLAIVTFLLDLGKGSGFKDKNVLEELNLSRSRFLKFTLKQRLATYVAAFALAFLLDKESPLSAAVIVAILAVVSECITRYNIRKRIELN